MSAKPATVNEPPDRPAGGAGAVVGTGVGAGVAVCSGTGVTSGAVVGAGAGVPAGDGVVAVGTGVLAGASFGASFDEGAGTVVGVGVSDVQAKDTRANTPMTKIPALNPCLIPSLLNRPHCNRMRLPGGAAKMVAANYRGTPRAGIS
jgi:hypothetical protein